MFSLCSIGKEAKGIGFGQVLNINKNDKTATIQVDATTWQHMVKCREVYKFGFNRTLTTDTLGNEIRRYRIEAKLNVRNPPNALFGVPIHFQWRMYEDENSICRFCCNSGLTIVIEDVKDAQESHWYYDEQSLPKRDDELDSFQEVSNRDTKICHNDDKSDSSVSGEDSDSDIDLDSEDDEAFKENIAELIREGLIKIKPKSKQAK
jgi:hypothetical protein